MRIRKLLAIIIAVGVGLLTFGTVFALEGEPGDPLPVCEGVQVSGTVVAVDEENMSLTIFTDLGELCTVTLEDGDYDHPIVSLLGQYFDDVHPVELQEALTYTVGCAIQDPESPAWLWTDCSDPEAIMVTVTGGAGGVFTATAMISDTLVVNSLLVTDTVTSDLIDDALLSLIVGLDILSGTVVEAGDKIAAYHDEGLGFGVLTKLFAIAREIQQDCEGTGSDGLPPEGANCDVTVDDLVILFRDEGVGMGQLFKQFDRPEKLGVGHVRKALKAEGGKKLGVGPPENRGNGRFTEDADDADKKLEFKNNKKEKSGKDVSNPPGKGKGKKLGHTKVKRDK